MAIPIHSHVIVTEFDKLIQASRERESRYVQQIEEQNHHLERLADEVHMLAQLIPELRENLSKAQQENQSQQDAFSRASEKWKKTDLKYQNEVDRGFGIHTFIDSKSQYRFAPTRRSKFK